MLTRRTFALGAASGILGGAFALGGFPQNAAGAGRGPSVEEVLHDPDQPVLGNLTGDLTIVEYFDYQCPFCKRYHPELVRAVERDGSIRLLMKDWPIFGATSRRAAQLALGGLADGTYKRAQDALMATEGRLSDQQVDGTLQAAGLSPERLREGYRSDRARLDALLIRNAQQTSAFGLSGTPAFIIGSVIYPGALNPGDLDRAIREARR
jgi:protein-disulfide isomerase